MVIFLYGEDTYRSRKKLDEIIAGYRQKHKSGLNFLRVDAQKQSFGDFFDALRMSSMFAETKLAVVENLFDDAVFQQAFLEKLSLLHAQRDVVVVWQAGMPDQRLKLFKTLKAQCAAQEFLPLEGKAAKAWAAAEFARHNRSINADALDYLISCVGNDLWRLSGEIQKIADFSPGPAVRRSEVALHVSPSLASDIFKTVDALAARDKRLAFELLRRHIDQGETPLYLLSMIAYQFRNLLVIKELAQQQLMYDSIVKKSGLHPFVVKKNYFACGKFSMEDLKRIYRDIFQSDLDIKTGKLDPETALELLVARI